MRLKATKPSLGNIGCLLEISKRHDGRLLSPRPSKVNERLFKVRG